MKTISWGRPDMRKKEGCKNVGTMHARAGYMHGTFGLWLRLAIDTTHLGNIALAVIAAISPFLPLSNPSLVQCRVSIFVQ
jgi:hypothetical protein